MKKIAHAELVAFLGERIDREKTNAAISDAARKLGYGPHEYDRQEALAILEELAQRQEALGIAARFAKARLLLA